MRFFFTLNDCYFAENETQKGETRGRKRKLGESKLSIEQSGMTKLILPVNSIMVGI